MNVRTINSTFGQYISEDIVSVNFEQKVPRIGSVLKTNGTKPVHSLQQKHLNRESQKCAK